MHIPSLAPQILEKKGFWKEFKISEKWILEKDVFTLIKLNINLCQLNNIKNREYLKLKPYLIFSSLIMT